MKMLRNGLVLIAVMVTAFASSAAQARPVYFDVMGGINYMTNTGGGLGYGGGAGLGFNLGPVAMFEVDGFFLSRGYSVGTNINWVQVPALLGFHLGPVFNLLAGAFYDVPVTTGASNNYGVTGGLRIKPPASPIFGQARFNYGLYTPNGASASTEVQAQLGLLF